MCVCVCTRARVCLCVRVYSSTKENIIVNTVSLKYMLT